jgi:hypothetical protein
MTETEWFSGTEPYQLVTGIQSLASDRKLRLFACHCCYRIWRLLSDPSLQRAVLIAEQFADGRATKEQRLEVRQAIRPGNRPRSFLLGAWNAARATTRSRARDAATDAPGASEMAIAWRRGRYDGAAGWQERLAQVKLLRHIVGNPFQAAPDASFGSSAVQLADAIYSGQDCSFALHDALLEAGHAELAEHFREPYHPKGCWALDLILGKS